MSVSSTAMKEVALVTGGTSGIGKAQVYRWVKEGYEVVFCGRNSERGAKISTESSAMFIQCDVTKAEEVEAMFNQIKEKWGRLDVVFNNAGQGTRSRRLHEIPLDLVAETIAINQMGAWHVLKFGLKLMVECGNGGRVVNNASVIGLGGAGAKLSCTHYAATKAALINMTKCTAIEYIPDNIRVNAIAATVIETEWFSAKLANAKDPLSVMAHLNSINPMGLYHNTLPQNDDVTGVVSFLAGPDAKYITGQTIAIDGGYSIQ